MQETRASKESLVGFWFQLPQFNTGLGSKQRGEGDTGAQTHISQGLAQLAQP